MNIKKMEQSVQKARDAFLEYDGVLGVGYGMKRIDGRPTETEAIIVFVESKRAADDVQMFVQLQKTLLNRKTPIRGSSSNPNSSNSPS